SNVIVEEPLFIPSGTKYGEGYLVNTALNFAEGATYCTVFNAQHIQDGPVATAKLDSYMPLGFHGAVI
ncbi:MAG: carotenoid oxygenase family protein, partial [Pseudomonadota bacterium]|nr:carotenoid oxygenase family protein [Pseudomonadota bacterium]